MGDPNKAVHLRPFHFRKGESGNKEGSSAYQNRRRAAREISTECLARISTALFDGDIPGLMKLASADDVTPIEKLCIGVVAKAWEKGDAQALNMLLDRFIGKAVERVVIKTQIDDSQSVINSLSDDELKRRQELLRDAD